MLSPRSPTDSGMTSCHKILQANITSEEARREEYLNDEEEKETAELVHKWTHTHSILCVVPSTVHKVIFCGTQDSKILVYDLESYCIKYVLECGHAAQKPSVLCMTLNESESFLFSGGSDSLIRVWDLSLIEDKIYCTHVVYLLIDIGDVFSISWSDALSTLFIGAQNASILWCRLSLESSSSHESSYTMERLPHFRYDRFFDSKGPGGSINYVQSKHQLIRTTSLREKMSTTSPKLIEICNEDVIRFAHNGFVHCMEYLDCSKNENSFLHRFSKSYQSVLISGGGDGLVIFWGLTAVPDGGVRLEKLNVLDNEDSVLSMSIENSDLYVGLSDPKIKIWDLMTFQLIRTICFTSKNCAYDEVLSLGIHKNCIYKASNFGGLLKITFKSYPSKVFIDEKKVLDNHENVIVTKLENNCDEVCDPQSDKSVLSVKTFKLDNKTLLVSGGHKALCLWDITTYSDTHPADSNPDISSKMRSRTDNDSLLNTLKKFVSYKTILRYPELYSDESRYCAQFLVSLLLAFGASNTRVLPIQNRNPVVYACFNRNSIVDPEVPLTRVLWYGHYDVVEVSDTPSWKTDPFHLTSKNGNLYARGATDNKGPILAALYAVSELHQKKELSCDIVFLIEGEEECGSVGFQKVVLDNKDLIGPIHWIMLSNSYWLDDTTPCLNYGLRGVVNARITVQSDRPDLHSGVDGGVLKEPTLDLIQLLNLLVNPYNNQIEIPGFYDDVLPISDKEIEFYRRIEIAAQDKDSFNLDFKTLVSKWRNPSLTIHKVDVSGPNNNTVIPRSATASISIRIVPNQDLTKIKNQLRETLESHFLKFDTPNKLSIEIFYEAEPWLGDPSNLVYKLLFEKMRLNWGPHVPEPLFVREGGSIPCVRFLEKCFNAPAAHIPCGQASDNAHLQNEKLRVLNLVKLKSILIDTFRELG